MPCDHTIKKPARQLGFTLVEVLVVTVILTVLMVAGYSAVQKALNAGRIVRSTQNLNQLALANILYASDYGTFAPADDKWNRKRWHGARTTASAAFDPADGFLAPYLGYARQVTPCPLLQHLISGTESFEQGTGGYGYNAQYIGGLPGGGYDKASGQRIAERLPRVVYPARTIMFATTAYARQDGLQEYPYAEPPFWDFGTGPSGTRPSPTVHFRANGKALVAWCDGHVTLEAPRQRPEGENPHGGDAGENDLGWFGPDTENGYWNPRRQNLEPE